MIKEKCMISRNTTVLVGVTSLFAGLVIPVAKAQQASGPVKVVQLTGLAGIKDNAKGTLIVENGQLHFAHGKASSDVGVASIQDVVTGADSQRTVGGAVGLMSMAAPYGGGRVLSLFRTKIDTLTVQYRDVDGGLHGAIFTMPVGTADVIKKELVAQGAQTIAPGESTTLATPAPSHASPNKSKPTKVKAAALQVEMIQSDEIKLPAEFQVALYENLIRQLEKSGFSHVYRDGDRKATSVADLVVLHSTVRGFKAGSERARQVTTVSGATSITVHCQFTSPDGTSLVDQDVNGKVRFFGSNLKATYDFAKKATHVANQNFSIPGRE
jgi:hypothetical protein